MKPAGGTCERITRPDEGEASERASERYGSLAGELVLSTQTSACVRVRFLRVLALANWPTGVASSRAPGSRLCQGEAEEEAVEGRWQRWASLPFKLQWLSLKRESES